MNGNASVSKSSAPLKKPSITRPVSPALQADLRHSAEDRSKVVARMRVMQDRLSRVEQAERERRSGEERRFHQRRRSL